MSLSLRKTCWKETTIRPVRCASKHPSYLSYRCSNTGSSTAEYIVTFCRRSWGMHQQATGWFNSLCHSLVEFLSGHAISLLQLASLHVLTPQHSSRNSLSRFLLCPSLQQVPGQAPSQHYLFPARMALAQTLCLCQLVPSLQQMRPLLDLRVSCSQDRPQLSPQGCLL